MHTVVCGEFYAMHKFERMCQELKVDHSGGPFPGGLCFPGLGFVSAVSNSILNRLLQDLEE